MLSQKGPIAINSAATNYYRKVFSDDSYFSWLKTRKVKFLKNYLCKI